MFHLVSLHTITADLSQAQPNLSGHINLHFVDSRTGTRINKIEIRWDQNTFIYSIGLNPPILLRAMITIDTTVLNHFAIEYNDNTLVIWVNGVSRKTHDLPLPALYDIELNEKFYGIVSLYHVQNRELKKIEIIMIMEQYVEYHVKAFTNNEVLT